MNNRPFLTITFGYLIGIIYGLYLVTSIAFYIAILISMLIIIYLKRYKINKYINLFIKKENILIFMISFVISFGITSILNYKYNKLFIGIDKCEGIAIIEEQTKQKDNYNQYKIKIYELNNNNKYKNTNVLLNTKLDLESGSQIKFKGEFKQGEESRNYRGFNYKQYLKSNGIYGTITSSNITIIKEKSYNVGAIISNCRKYAINVIKSNFEDENNANILLGILIGNDDNILKSQKEAYRKSSLSHIMAVSGLHVSFVIIGINKFFGLIKISKKYKNIIIIIFLIFFCLLVGSTPSVKRACIMAILAVIARLII